MRAQNTGGCGLEGTYESEVAADGARGRSERVGGTEDDAAGLDGVTALPDHGADGAGAHVWVLSALCSSFCI